MQSSKQVDVCVVQLSMIVYLAKELCLEKWWVLSSHFTLMEKVGRIGFIVEKYYSVEIMKIINFQQEWIIINMSVLHVHFLCEVKNGYPIDQC